MQGQGTEGKVSGCGTKDSLQCFGSRVSAHACRSAARIHTCPTQTAKARACSPSPASRPLAGLRPPLLLAGLWRVNSS